MSQMVVDVEDEELTSDEDVPQFNDEGKEETAAGVTLKKGPWTAAEDAMLVDYVKKNGEGNWNNVQKNTALSRCGKSCRLRWANHLRPNLKKGAFTPEEEELIVKLQHKMGNKWARMAQHLPGRTDNEIKNYWNTRVKRRQRAGLPLYPPELCVQESKESELGRSTVVKMEDRGQTQFSLENSYQECDTFFESMNANLGGFPHYPPILDLSPNSILMNSLSSSQHLDILPSSSPYNTRFHDSTMSFHRSSGLFSNGFHPLPRCKDFPSYAGFTQSLFGYRSLLSLPPQNSLCISHSLSNCIPSTSMPTIEVVKSELPSFQFRQDTSLPPLHESVYGTPLITSLPKSDHSCNSGLLDDVIHHARHVSSSKNLCSDKSSNSSITAPGEDCYSTFGTTSYESLTVNASKNTFNEQQLAQTLNESFRKAESAHQPWTPISPEEEWAESLIILRDGENYVEMSDSEATLASGEDLARGLDSRPWNNMLGAVGEMSDLP